MSEFQTERKMSDGAALALLGKKEVLERRFAFLSLFAFAVAELITWETVLALFGQAFNNGGPSGAVYGFMIAWLSSLSVYTCISELASLAPISGGQYYWVYMMAPARWKTVASYMIGWLTSLAWVATVATETLFAGTIIQGVAVLDYPGRYEPLMYQGTLLTIAVILLCVFINVVIPGWLPRIEIFILVIHVAGFIAIMTTLLATTAQHGGLGSADSVWRTALNEGGWPTQGLSFCVGFLGNVATFVGADASVHMAEEVSDAARTLPRAIVGAVAINGCVGLAMMVALLYCLGDPQTVLESKTGFPFIQVFYNSTRSAAGASVMAAVVIALTFACCAGITTTASRMVWSFARDNGLPWSRFLARVKPTSKVPVVAVFAVTVLAALLTLIYIGSYTAFNDVISLTITGFYGSYFIPCALLLYHRVKGNIHPHGSTPEQAQRALPLDGSGSSNDAIASGDRQGEKGPVAAGHGADGASASNAAAEDVTAAINDGRVDKETAVANAHLVWGPWHLPGVFGTINNAYACAYMLFVIFWSVWPPETPVDAASMNYSVVVTGGVMILSGIWYFIGGRKQYKGPLIDDEVAAIMRLGSVVAVQ